MEKKLSFKDYLSISSMLFGLFFGAGNLIFPIHLGQEAGSHVLPAILGFILTGVGLPFLGVIAIGISRQNGILEVAKRIHPLYGTIFTILLYLVIGPFFALPRLASTSYEIALAPLIPENNQRVMLFIFSALFFIFAYIGAKKPAKLLAYIGKYLNPLFLILLFIIIALAFLNPFGAIHQGMPVGTYQQQAFVTGLKQGYNTLDAIASLAFGIIVVSTLKNLGVKKPVDIAKGTVKSGLISILTMGVLYLSLGLMGAMSLGKFELSENGGLALAQIAHAYLGNFGSILLAFIVIIACFKTAIGLITAFSETLNEIFPRIAYEKWIIISAVLPALFANVGLTNIINGSTPVLMFVYPLAITLILLVFIGPFLKESLIIYQSVTFFTFLAALLDGINALPQQVKNLPFFHHILQWAEKIPLFSLGMSWLLFALTGLIIGLLLYPVTSKKIYWE